MIRYFFKSFKISTSSWANLLGEDVALDSTSFGRGLPPTFKIKISIKTTSWGTQFIFFVTFNYNNRPIRSWSKLNHPTIGEKERRSSLLPRASSYAKGTIFIFYFQKYSRSNLFIALSFSYTINLLYFVLLKPSSIS